MALAGQHSATPDGKYNLHGKVGRALGPSNKRMQLTKLSAAPTLAPQAVLARRCRLMPAPAWMDAGTASQLIRSVRPTEKREESRGW